MNRQAFYDPLVVTETHLSRLQDDIEAADRNLVADHLGDGVAYGLGLTENATPSMVLRVAAGVAYDPLGRRVEVPSVQSPDLTNDYLGSPTAVTAGNERYVAVYLRYLAAESEPYTDPAATPTTGNLRVTESYQLRVVAGTMAAAGLATYPAAPDANHILLGRIRRVNGQTALYTRDVMTNDVVFARRAIDVFEDSVERRLECSASNPPSLSVVVAAGYALIDGLRIAYGGGSVSCGPAPTGNPRIDLVFLSGAGTLGVRTGVEGASPGYPSARGVLPVAYVRLDPGDVAILDEAILDARPWHQAESGTMRQYRVVAAGGETTITLPWAYETGAHALLVYLNGSVLDETQYTEASDTSITVAPLAPADVLFIRALEVQPLASVALSAVTDDLSGVLVGAEEVVAEDRGGGMAVYVSPIQALVLGNIRFSSAELDISATAMSVSTWFYLYVYASGGSLALELSTTAPAAGRIFKSGDTSRRYLGAVRTDSTGTAMAFRRVRGMHRWTRTGITVARLRALSSGSAAAWADVSLASQMPPHARLARLRLSLNAPAGGGNLNVRTKGTSASSVDMTAPPTAAGWTNNEELDLATDSAQAIQYQVGGGGETLHVDVLGWQE